MKTKFVVLLFMPLLLNMIGCGYKQTIEPTLRDDEQSFSLNKKSVSTNSVSYFAIDPFADLVVEDGVNNQGQGFPDPAGVLGILQVLDLTKSPPVVGVGVNGFVVVDMGVGEEIFNGPGIDFMVIEADGSLLAAGFGAPEPFMVSVSNSPTGPFINLGTTNGNGFFDLNGSGLSGARYVRLQDAGGNPPSGADLQGIAAFNFRGGDFKLTPSTINRSSNRKHVTGHLQLPNGFNVTSASIVLVALLNQPSPTPPPFTTSLDIPGQLLGNGNTVKFDATQFLDAAPDGDDIVVTVKLTSTSDEVLYLFDLVNIWP